MTNHKICSSRGLCLVALICLSFPRGALATELILESDSAQELESLRREGPARRKQSLLSQVQEGAVHGPSPENGIRTPIDAYHYVWKLINDKYFDPSCNSQDWSRWEHRYDKDLVSDEDAFEAIDTMIASLADPYTRFYEFPRSPSNGAKLRGGVGINIGARHGVFFVSAPVPGSIAAAAGIMPEDIIISVDGDQITGLSLQDATDKIRGQIGTEVSLTILRKKQLQTYLLKRGLFSLPSVSPVVMLDSQLGYIKVNHLRSVEGLEGSLNALLKLNSAKGLILDLRNSFDGSIGNVVSFCNKFLSRKTVFSIRDRDGIKRETVSGDLPVCKQKIVILVNKGTGGVMKMVCAALQDNRRALVVGEESSTEASRLVNLQSVGIFGCADISMGCYLTPNGDEIENSPIKPDYRVGLGDSLIASKHGPWFLYCPNSDAFSAGPPHESSDIQLAKAIQVLKSL